MPLLPSVQERVEQLYRPSSAIDVATNQTPGSLPFSQEPVSTQTATDSPNKQQPRPRSRREIRQQEAALQAPPQVPQSISASQAQATAFGGLALPLPAILPLAIEQPSAGPETASRRELRERLRQTSEPLVASASESAPSRPEPGLAPMFETSSGFSLDTTTNSIVLPVTPNALPEVLLTTSGVTLRTGSIQLPNLNSGTGAIPLPLAAQLADDAQRLDSATSFVTSISPVAAQNLIKQNPKLGFAPVRSKGTQGQLFYGLTTSILMLTVGGLLLASWMLGFIK